MVFSQFRSAPLLLIATLFACGMPDDELLTGGANGAAPAEKKGGGTGGASGAPGAADAGSPSIDSGTTLNEAGVPKDGGAFDPDDGAPPPPVEDPPSQPPPPVTLPCTAGKIFGAGASIATINSAIASAVAGDVICLTRGATFSGSSGLSISNTAGTAASPITICSATGNQCSDSGAANAKFSVAGAVSAIRINAGVKYLNFSNVDLEGNGNTDGIGIEFQYGSATPPHHVSVAGGKCSNFGVCWLSNPWSNSAPPTNIALGNCASPWFIRHTTGFAGGGYGAFQDSKLSMDMADTGANGMFSHNIYFSTGPWDGEVSGDVVECSHFTQSGLDGPTSVGLHLKVSGHVAGITVRNNVFEDANCGTYAIGVGTSNDDLAEDYGSLDIHDNLFHTGCPINISCDACYNTKIYNNVFRTYAQLQNNQGPSVVLGDMGPAARYGNNQIFNNTFIDMSQAGFDPAIVRVEASHLGANKFFNNLIHTNAGNTKIIDADCARFGGTNGPDFANNFVFTPNAAPNMLACAGGAGNSTNFKVDPGLVDINGGNFDISATSAVSGKGRATGAPTTDFTGKPRPATPSIGAFDL